MRKPEQVARYALAPNRDSPRARVELAVGMLGRPLVRSGEQRRRILDSLLGESTPSTRNTQPGSNPVVCQAPRGERDKLRPIFEVDPWHDPLVLAADWRMAAFL